jgi:uncharacterized protein (TIGR02453 family)
MSATRPAAAYEPFRPEALQFLADLAQHNDRAWFQPRKAEFERLVKTPMEALCTVLAERFAEQDVPLLADPKRSPFRIYRDTRFSKDKSPYKTWQGAEFPWLGGATVESGARSAAGGYFHFAPGEIFVGGGMWHPDRERLAAFRTVVDREPERVLAATRDPAFAATYGSIEGDRLTRVPAGFRADHPQADLLRLKDVVFSRRLSDAEATSTDLPDLITSSMAAAVPVLRLLAGLIP